MDATYDGAPLEKWHAAPPPEPHEKKSRLEIGELLSHARGPTPPTAAVAPAPPRASAADEPTENPPVVRRGFAAELLEVEGDARSLARRAALGLGLASLYGLALGAREGGIALLVHALGVPAAQLAVALLGLPALFILLALLDAPLTARRALGAAVRGIASSGLVLAGLAPLAALYVVTSASPAAAATAAALGLAFGGLLGLRHLLSTLREALEGADRATHTMATLAQVAFGLFALLLGWRVWSALLPLVGGAS